MNRRTKGKRSGKTIPGIQHSLLGAAAFGGEALEIARIGVPRGRKIAAEAAMEFIRKSPDGALPLPDISIVEIVE